jgi:hypothetical protein
MHVWGVGTQSLVVIDNKTRSSEPHDRHYAAHPSSSSLKCPLLRPRLVCQLLHREGFTVIPSPGVPEVWSMITAVELRSRERMTAFCRGIQRTCPIGSYITPEPGETRGEVRGGRLGGRGHGGRVSLIADVRTTVQQEYDRGTGTEQTCGVASTPARIHLRRLHVPRGTPPRALDDACMPMT